MPSFALVTEGITDQIVIDHLISTIIGNFSEEDADVNILQPLRDATDEARQAKGKFGGWEKVLEFCRNEARLNEALEFNEYLVIQIDTDCCGHVNFGVPLYKEGIELKALELIADVQNYIKACLGDVYQNNADRIIFAIAVHSTECWLMPFYAREEHHKSREKSCAEHLTRALIKEQIKYEKTHACYTHLCKPLKKYKTINDNKSSSTSLNNFIDSLLCISTAPIAAD
ncbi:phage tail protein [Pseudomonas lundensis]|uniref:phage tail protein n=1 Tax=Pseudomonas lundensis TaxID=86185 RepID=UPI001891BBC4|nr:phage tail protein [Pseudomonas lundensis]QOF91885.1 phage tail protein [Pseudomonas lundensis]